MWTKYLHEDSQVGMVELEEEHGDAKDKDAQNRTPWSTPQKDCQYRCEQEQEQEQEEMEPPQGYPAQEGLHGASNQ